jgi:hypothetical protein
VVADATGDGKLDLVAVSDESSPGHEPLHCDRMVGAVRRIGERAVRARDPTGSVAAVSAT